MLKKYLLLSLIGLSLYANAQFKNSCGVTAGFNTAPVCIDVCEVFSNTSTGAAKFSWNFGDSITSTAPSPQHCYKYPGTFKVTLVADNGTCSDTAWQYVQIYPVPAPFFTASGSGCSSLCVNFIDMSTVSTGGTIVAWDWNFGDGTPASNIPDPYHCYANKGTYAVTLTVTSNGGCDSSITLPVVVLPNPAPAIVVTPYPVQVGVPTTFADTAKGDVNCVWNFGDGTTGNGDTIVHTYSIAGTYKVFVTVTSDSGCMFTDSLLITVPSGVQNINNPNETISIYPNPGSGKFELKTANYSPGIKTVEVYDVLGERVFQSQCPSLNSQYHIDISSQPSGLYFVKMISGQSSKVVKYIKE